MLLNVHKMEDFQPKMCVLLDENFQTRRNISDRLDFVGRREEGGGKCHYVTDCMCGSVMNCALTDVILMSYTPASQCRVQL